MPDKIEGAKAILERSLPTRSSFLPEVGEGGWVELLSETPEEKEAAKKRWEEFVNNSGMSLDEVGQYLINVARTPGGWFTLP